MTLFCTFSGAQSSRSLHQCLSMWDCCDSLGRTKHLHLLYKLVVVLLCGIGCLWRIAGGALQAFKTSRQQRTGQSLLVVPKTPLAMDPHAYVSVVTPSVVVAEGVYQFLRGSMFGAIWGLVTPFYPLFSAGAAKGEFIE